MSIVYEQNYESMVSVTLNFRFSFYNHLFSGVSLCNKEICFTACCWISAAEICRSFISTNDI